MSAMSALFDITKEMAWSVIIGLASLGKVLN